MPTVNIFHQAELSVDVLHKNLMSLRDFLAKELTCGDIALKPEEVSVRIISVQGAGMIAPVEIEVTAHAFEDRIKRQDEICLRIREFIKQKLNVPHDVRVWLLLPQLGHSWEE